jgi:predicted membrane chloride channel (bestrophin family)
MQLNINKYTLRFQDKEIQHEWFHYEIKKKANVLGLCAAFMIGFSLFNEGVIMADYFYMYDPVVMIARFIIFLTGIISIYICYFWRHSYYEEYIEKRDSELQMMAQRSKLV